MRQYAGQASCRRTGALAAVLSFGVVSAKARPRPISGVRAPGKLADLIVLDGDPTTDIINTRKVYAVWHRGKKVAGSIETFAP